MEYIDNIINLNYMERSSISLSKAVLILYLIIANNYTTKLLSGQFTDFLEKNRYAQHFVGYLTMMVVINSFGGVTDPKVAALYALVGYLWFIFTTKLDLTWNLAILGFMVLVLLYESSMVDKEVRSDRDQALEESDKERIRRRHNELKTLIIIAIVALTVIGTTMYLNKKQVQYGGNFDGIKFILG